MTCRAHLWTPWQRALWQFISYELEEHSASRAQTSSGLSLVSSHLPQHLSEYHLRFIGHVTPTFHSPLTSLTHVQHESKSCLLSLRTQAEPACCPTSPVFLLRSGLPWQLLRWLQQSCNDLSASIVISGSAGDQYSQRLSPHSKAQIFTTASNTAQPQPPPAPHLTVYLPAPPLLYSRHKDILPSSPPPFSFPSIPLFPSSTLF